jgi:alkylation response protein AidB-like acyl-CoA dehydrogenase
VEVVGQLAADISSRWQLGRGPASVADGEPPPGAWQTILDAELLGLRLDPAAGGSAADCVDVCLLSEQLGRHAVPAPVLGTMVVLEQLRVRQAHAATLAEIAAGRRRLAPVLTEDLTAFADSAAGALGWDCAGAEHGVVLAEHAELYPLRRVEPGVDLTRAFGRVDTDVVPGEPIELGASLDGEQTDRLTAFAITVVAADLLGVMQGALDLAVTHAKTRTQFGAAIGSFQAIQHLLAECLVSVEATRSAVWYAAWAADELSGEQALQAARAAKAFASVAGVEVTEAAVQVLGGMGMTWESRAHVFLRRAQVDRRLFGDENVQYERLATARFDAPATLVELRG